MKNILKTAAVIAAVISGSSAYAAQCELAGLYQESQLAQIQLERALFELRAKRAELALRHPGQCTEIYSSAISLPSSEYLHDAKIADEHAYPHTCDARFLRAAHQQVSAARSAELVRLMKFDSASEVVGQ